MQFEATALDGVLMVTPKKFGDHRGFFSETWNRATLAQAGVILDFVQDNHSFSAEVGTIRGLHFQSAPFAQAKLVRVVRGRIWDVVIDIRRSSPSYGRHVGVELSNKNWRQLLVPVGFAHGFCTMEPDTEVMYKVTAPYAPAHDHGLAWDDPALNVAWPVSADRAVLSDKDRWHPRLTELPTYFE